MISSPSPMENFEQRFADEQRVAKAAAVVGAVSGRLVCCTLHDPEGCRRAWVLYGNNSHFPSLLEDRELLDAADRITAFIREPEKAGS